MEVTTQLPSMEVDKEKIEQVVETATQAEGVTDVDITTQETTQEPQGELVKSPIKEIATLEENSPQEMPNPKNMQEIPKEIEVAKSPSKNIKKGKEIRIEQPPPAATSIEEATQQPQEWTSDGELPDQRSGFERTTRTSKSVARSRAQAVMTQRSRRECSWISSGYVSSKESQGILS
ncbi:hypothetical protein L7F22_016129 [Adiantum nelumboides]|nr:hypothetical protein [Adiantum nelumboides]